MIGFAEYEFQVGNKINFNIQLEPEATELNEVVVSAYAAQLGFEVTSLAINSLVEGVPAPNQVSFRINVSAFDQNGNEFTQPAIYTRYATVTLAPQGTISE